MEIEIIGSAEHCGNKRAYSEHRKHVPMAFCEFLPYKEAYKSGYPNDTHRGIIAVEQPTKTGICKGYEDQNSPTALTGLAYNPAKLTP